MQVTNLVSQLSDISSTGNHQRNASLVVALRNQPAQGQAISGIVAPSDKVVTQTNTDYPTNNLASNTQNAVAKGNSGNTPAAWARQTISTESQTSQPFGSLVRGFPKGSTLVSENTGGGIVQVKGAEKSMAIKQPLDKVLQKYNHGASIAESGTAAKVAPSVIDAQPKPLDPRAMGGGDKVSALSADVEA